MSNWTGKRRAGGGTRIGTQANAMDQAVTDSSTQIGVLYVREVNSTDLNVAFFRTLPSNFTPISVTQNDGTSVFFTFTDDVGDETDFRYNGNQQQFVSPQTVPLEEP